MRTEIAESWERCQLLELSRSFSFDTPKEDGTRDHFKGILSLLRPILEMFVLSYRDRDCSIMLIDEFGCVLEVIPSESAGPSVICPGHHLQENSCGTNAAALAICHAKSIYVQKEEHYIHLFRNSTTFCVPIFIPDKFYGYLFFLLNKGDIDINLTLKFMDSTVDIIKSTIQSYGIISTTNYLNTFLQRILDSMSDGVIAITPSMHITHMNRVAAGMLGIDQNAYGADFFSLFLPEEPLYSSLRTQSALRMQEVNIRTGREIRRLFCSVEVLPDMEGVILRMVGKKDMVRIAKKVSGNVARYQFSDVIGMNELLQQQVELAEKSARTDSRVMIYGESGTGKEVFAQAIHNASSRSNEPFVGVSCSAIPHDLIESELFGYVAGAFTGARREGMIGKCELANNGTLFLDDVDGMPLAMQAKMLRFLQQNEIVRLGDSRVIPLNVRVIAATNKKLMDEVKLGNFREDLFYRLSVIDIYLPALRDRKDDLGYLCDHILTKKCRQLMRQRPAISADVQMCFRQYPWPGNIRELENCLERALSLCGQGPIVLEHLPAQIREYRETRTKGNTAGAAEGIKMNVHRTTRPQDFTREHLEQVLVQCGGNVSAAARSLQVSRTTLYQYLKRLDVSLKGN